MRFGLGFGLLADARGVSVAGLLGGLFLAEMPGHFFHVADRFGKARGRVVVFWGRARARRLGLVCGFGLGAAPGLWPGFGDLPLAGAVEVLGSDVNLSSGSATRLPMMAMGVSLLILPGALAGRHGEHPAGSPQAWVPSARTGPDGRGLTRETSRVE